jgi:NADPH:quinone reductase-like Zn-dependent oxidoreductase
MKAIVCERYGSPDVLCVREVVTPIPKQNDALIRVRATTVNSADVRIRALNTPRGFRAIMRLVFGFRGPRQPILGSELAGDVVAVGSNVTGYQIGDKVFAFPGVRMRAHAEYVCMPEDGALARIPSNLDYDEAAALSFAGTTVLDFFRRAQLVAGEHILVNGASGALGTAAIQLAKARGAVVTAVCSEANAALVTSLGADRVIDYTQVDFASTGDQYDVVFDAVGNVNVKRARPTMKAGGRLLLLVADLPTLLSLPWVAITERRFKVIAGPASERAEDLKAMAFLAESGRYRPVIDRRYPFDQIADAHRYVDTGRKRGSVAVMLSQEKDESNAELLARR